MKREIKFRAFHPDLKIMRYSRNLGTFFDHEIFPYQNWDLMQYTGLKDKNGKDCYHKDIGITPEGLKGIIEWDELRYAWIFQDEMKFNELLFTRSYKLEIIGNNYENKNLIES